MTNQSAPQETTITITGGLAYVQPAHQHLLAPLLQWRRREPTLRPNGRVQWSIGSEQLFAVESGRLEIPTGLVPRVVRALEQHRHHVSINDHRALDRPAFQVDQDVLLTLEPSQRQLADAIIAHPMGQIQLPGRRAWLDTVVLVANLFPAARILVMHPHARECAQLASDLLPRLGARVGRATCRNWRTICQVVLCTIARSAYAHPSRYDIVIVLTAGAIAVKDCHRTLAELTPHRRYGFVDPRERDCRDLALHLEAFVGPVIIAAPERDRRATVRVCSLSISVSPGARSGDPLADKRALIWKNPVRNRRIADTALAVARRDHARLAELGCHLPADALAALTGPVVVLVESPEHARQFAAWLPAWPVRSGIAAAGSSLDCGNAPGCILTMVRAASMRMVPAAVLIRADGGCDGLPFQGWQAMSESRSEILLIDVDDRFDLESRAHNQQRFSAYRDQGYVIDEASDR